MASFAIKPLHDSAPIRAALDAVLLEQLASLPLSEG